MTVLVEKSVTTLEDGIENLLESAKTDYINRYDDDVNSDVAKTMIDRFNNGFVVKSGQKYIKIMCENGGSAWAFIVKDDNTLSPWLVESTNQSVFMLSSDKILTLVDPKPTLLEKYQDLLK